MVNSAAVSGYLQQVSRLQKYDFHPAVKHSGQKKASQYFTDSMYQLRFITFVAFTPVQLYLDGSNGCTLRSCSGMHSCLLWNIRMWCELLCLLLCLITIQLFEFILIKIELSFHSNHNDQKIVTWYTNTVLFVNFKCNEAS